MPNERMLEREFQDKIYNSLEIQENLVNALDIDQNSFLLKREIEFVNGITADFIISNTETNEMQAIIECKRADIGVTEYVRGVGQLFQYEHFQKKGIRPKNLSQISYNDRENRNVLVIPSSFIANTNLNIGLFCYPETAKILEVHVNNNRVREISKDELTKLADATVESLKTISQYYVRDNRLFECYIALRVIGILKHLHISLNRSDIENKILRQVEVINNRNWRNAFITLSSLGFMSRRDGLSNIEAQLIPSDVYNFISSMYKDYLYPYIDILMDILIENSTDNMCNLNNQQISNLIRTRYEGKDVLFLTESNGRYIYSWLNIMRDDFGCIQFEARSSERKIIYKPSELQQSDLTRKIKEYSNAKQYVDSFEANINRIIVDILAQNQIHFN